MIVTKYNAASSLWAYLQKCLVKANPMVRNSNIVSLYHVYCDLTLARSKFIPAHSSSAISAIRRGSTERSQYIPRNALLPTHNYKATKRHLSCAEAVIACNLHKHAKSLGLPPLNVPFQRRLGNINLLHSSTYGLTLGGSRI
jgi:hypothetical protein